MSLLKDVLQISTELYEHLGNVPKGEGRDPYIEEIVSKVEVRAELADQLVSDGFVYDSTNSTHKILFELDRGIKERLGLVLHSVKSDMKDLQTSKKQEQQYTNPYGHVQTMDGMYYDKKK